MSSYNVKNGNRGLKAFIAVVCVLLVVAIVGSFLVLWRTTNGFREMPSFDDSCEDDFLVEDDLSYNSDLSTLSLNISDSITPLSSEVLDSKEVTVSSSQDLSQFTWSWFLRVDDSSYYDGCWHDVLGYEFDGDFEIDDYVRLTNMTANSVLVEFLDYFPSTIYLYYYLFNGVDEVVARCLVDCVCRVNEFSTFVYIGDLLPSFSFGVSGGAEGFRVYARSRYSSEFVFPDDAWFVNSDFFDGIIYLDGMGNCYNVLYYGDISFLTGSYDEFMSAKYAEQDVYCRYDFPLSAVCSAAFGEVDGHYGSGTDWSPNLKICSGNFSPFGFRVDDDVSMSDFMSSSCLYPCSLSDSEKAELYAETLLCCFSDIGCVFVPRITDYQPGSYLSESFYEYFSYEMQPYFYDTVDSYFGDEHRSQSLEVELSYDLPVFFVEIDYGVFSLCELYLPNYYEDNGQLVYTPSSDCFWEGTAQVFFNLVAHQLDDSLSKIVRSFDSTFFAVEVSSSLSGFLFGIYFGVDFTCCDLFSYFS